MLKIRPMAASDADRVAHLMSQLGYPSTSQQIAQRFERIDGQSNQALFVADDDGQVVASVHVAANPYLENDASAEILGLVVADEYRSQGIGKALVSAAEAWAARLGCGVLRVRSNTIRTRAHAFYDRAGFHRVKTQLCFEKEIG
jgi:GNAT superfamily N-acetyltransferase